jgi:hypothetical protein
VTGKRYELPEGLTPAEERAVLAALEQYFAPRDRRPDPWGLVGKLDATGQGALQARRLTRESWRMAGRSAFARRGVPPFAGRGDAR